MTTLTHTHPGTRHRIGLVRWLLAWHRNHHQRQSLCRMDDAQLRDVGLTRTDIRCDNARTRWNPPHYWLS